MTYAWGSRSRSRLLSCVPELVQAANLVMSWQLMDITIICGHRNEEEQTLAYLAGNSTKQWPNSCHNVYQSMALDFGPWVGGRVPWEDTHAFAMLGGMFLVAGNILDTPIRYGGDWNRNGSTKDQSLMDWGHIELLCQAR